MSMKMKARKSNRSHFSGLVQYCLSIWASEGEFLWQIQCHCENSSLVCKVLGAVDHSHDSISSPDNESRLTNQPSDCYSVLDYNSQDNHRLYGSGPLIGIISCVGILFARASFWALPQVESDKHWGTDKIKFLDAKAKNQILEHGKYVKVKPPHGSHSGCLLSQPSLVTFFINVLMNYTGCIILGKSFLLSKIQCLYPQIINVKCQY